MILTKKIKNSKQHASLITETLSSMGPYILLAFAAGQFIAYFNWSNLGVILAVNGANILKNIGFGGLPLLITFLLFTAIANIFMYSASAKWALFAPVFIPMFMLMGYSPETVQVVYRIADSVTNNITPLLPYLPIVLVTAKKYDKDINIGKFISYMIPYSIYMLILWIIMLVLWIIFQIPLGPDVNIYYHI